MAEVDDVPPDGGDDGLGGSAGTPLIGGSGLDREETGDDPSVSFDFNQRLADAGLDRDEAGRFVAKPPTANDTETAKPQDDGEGADPWTGYGEEARQLAKAKGWADPSSGMNELARSYRELEQRLGQASGGREVEQLRRQMDDLARQNQQLAQMVQGVAQPPPQEQDLIDFGAMVNDDLNGDPGPALNFLAHQYLPGLVEAIVEQRVQSFREREFLPTVKPIAEHVGANRQLQVAQGLQQKYGPAFAEHADEVIALLKSDATLAQHPNGMEMAYGLVHSRHFSERQAREAAAAAATRERTAREQDAGTLDRGSNAPPPQTVTAEQAIRQTLLGGRPTYGDGLG